MPNRRNSNNLARGERLQIMLSPDELTAVDDFRNRMPSRAAAVRELFRMGLASTSLVHSGDGKKSSDIGVFDSNAGKPNAALRMVPKDGA